MDESEKDLVNRGNFLLDRGEYEEAITFYEKALSINSQNVVALTNKGTALDQLGKYEEAVKCFDKVLEINPKDEEALNNKGSSLIKLNRYEEAVKYFDKVLAINPYNFVTHYNKGIALGKLGKYEEAIKSYDETIKIVPDYAIAIYSKGATLLNLAYQLSCEKRIKNTEEALELFKTVWKLRDKIPDKGKELQSSFQDLMSDIFLILVNQCGSEGLRVAHKIKEFLCDVLDQKMYQDFLEEMQINIPADLKHYREVIALLDETCPKHEK